LNSANTEAHGLSAYDGATGQTTRLATAPPGSYFAGLVAGSGYLAWNAVTVDPRALSPEEIYLAPARNPAAATRIGTGWGRIIISGDHLWWTRIVLQANGAYNPETDVEVVMYTFSTGTTQVLDRGGATNLSVSEDRVAWGLPV